MRGPACPTDLQRGPTDEEGREGHRELPGPDRGVGDGLWLDQEVGQCDALRGRGSEGKGW